MLVYEKGPICENILDKAHVYEGHLVDSRDDHIRDLLF